MTTVAEAERWLIARRRGGRGRDGAAARSLIAALGLRDPPAVVHVVGTNGKGSVAHALAAMAVAEGHRTGRFTSPHVESLSERIAIDGAPLPDELLRAFVARVAPLAERGALPEVGFFEWTLALALERFEAEGVTLAVVEAGVGARRDATSALGAVVASVVTNVTLDHLEALGPGIRQIALDKAAAARAGVPLVTAARGEALDVLRHAADGVGSPLVALADSDERFALPAGIRLAAQTPPTHLENLLVACATARVIGLGEEAIARGCLAPRPIARYERFELGDRCGILDGAHDPAAASALAAALPRPYALVFGALARKQGGATYAPLAARAAWRVLTAATVDDPPGPWPADERAEDPALALALALERAGPGGTVVVAGSLYLAGRLRPELVRRAAAAVPTEALTSGC